MNQPYKAVALLAGLAASFALGRTTATGSDEEVSPPSPTKPATFDFNGAKQRVDIPVNAHVVELERGGNFETAERNAQILRRAVVEHPAIHIIAGTAENPAYVARPTMVSDHSITNYDGEQIRFAFNDQPCVDIGSAKVFLTGVIAAYYDSMTIFDVNDAGAITAVPTFGGALTTRRFLKVLAKRASKENYFEYSTMPSREEIARYLGRYVPPLDGEVYAQKGTDQFGFGTTGSARVAGASVDSFDNSSVDTRNLTEGGYGKRFPQLDADGEYSGKTASTWGFHNGIISQATALVRVRSKQVPAKLDGLFIIGSVGAGIEYGRNTNPKQPMIVSRSVTTNCVLAYHYHAGCIDSAYDMLIRYNVNVYHTGHFAVVDIPPTGNYINPGYGFCSPRQTVQTGELTVACRAEYCARKGYDKHAAATGQVIDSEFHGLMFGADFGVTERLTAAVAPEVLKSGTLLFKNCEFSGFYGVSGDNSEYFVDRAGVSQYRIVLQGCRIKGTYGLKNVYPRPVFEFYDLHVEKAEFPSRQNSNPIGVWLGSVVASRGLFDDPSGRTLHIRSSTGFAPGRAIVIEEATDHIKLYAPNNSRADVTLPANRPNVIVTLSDYNGGDISFTPVRHTRVDVRPAVLPETFFEAKGRPGTKVFAEQLEAYARTNAPEADTYYYDDETKRTYLIKSGRPLLPDGITIMRIAGEEPHTGENVAIIVGDQSAKAKKWRRTGNRVASDIPVDGTLFTQPTIAAAYNQVKDRLTGYAVLAVVTPGSKVGFQPMVAVEDQPTGQPAQPPVQPSVPASADVTVVRVAGDAPYSSDRIGLLIGAAKPDTSKTYVFDTAKQRVVLSEVTFDDKMFSNPAEFLKPHTSSLPAGLYAVVTPGNKLAFQPLKAAG